MQRIVKRTIIPAGQGKVRKAGNGTRIARDSRGNLYAVKPMANAGGVIATKPTDYLTPFGNVARVVDLKATGTKVGNWWTNTPASQNVSKVMAKPTKGATATRVATQKSTKAKVGNVVNAAVHSFGEQIDDFRNPGHTGWEIADAGVNTAGRAAGTWAGAHLGAALGGLGGPLVPVTVPVGALLGGALGYWGGKQASNAVTHAARNAWDEGFADEQRLRDAGYRQNIDGTWAAPGEEVDRGTGFGATLEDAVQNASYAPEWLRPVLATGSQGQGKTKSKKNAVKKKPLTKRRTQEIISQEVAKATKKSSAKKQSGSGFARAKKKSIR